MRRKTKETIKNVVLTIIAIVLIAYSFKFMVTHDYYNVSELEKQYEQTHNINFEGE